MKTNSHDQQQPKPPGKPGQWRLFAVWALIFGIGIGFFAGYVIGVDVGKDSITMLDAEPTP
ncbi:hypothetical protein [Fodinicurvata sp. EGI_FJ10296]|uniref:hypothetical protein n=1 Tax=Fodinicurvata sp. EGI_FJ10296 TaxID=3231908 RepID=UPI003454DD62